MKLTKSQWQLRTVLALAVLALVPLAALGVFGPSSLAARSSLVPELVGYAPWDGAVGGVRSSGKPASASPDEVELFLNNWQYTQVIPSPSGPAIRHRDNRGTVKPAPPKPPKGPAIRHRG